MGVTRRPASWPIPGGGSLCRRDRPLTVTAARTREGSESGANSESESQKKSESAPEPQKEFYANCKEAKAAELHLVSR